MRLEMLRPRHLEHFVPQPMQAKAVSKGWQNKLLKSQGLKGAFVADGRPVALAGVKGSQVKAAWTLLSHEAGPYLCALTRHIKNLIKNEPADIYIYIEKKCPNARRWALMLGFDESGLDGYGPYDLWVKHPEKRC